MATATLSQQLAATLGPGAVLANGEAGFLDDESRTSGLRGRADAVVLPDTTDGVAAVLRWCYDRGVPVTPRGGGTGYSGGAVPDGGVVIGLERLNRVRAFDPLLWRIHVEAGVTTEAVRALARANGLLFPPDPGAAATSQIGGNIATNAGGPHTFKYGTTGRWVTGLEVVVPPGKVMCIGGRVRKDVAGYDLKSLIVGSEGTLGIVTSAWLALIPAPELALPLAAFFSDSRQGCAAIEEILGSGLQPSVLEFFDERTIATASAGFPGPSVGGFLVIAEADGSAAEAVRLRDDLVSVLEERAISIWSPEHSEIADLWRWRESISGAVTSVRGGKLSEDIVVPLDRLCEAVARTVDIGERHGLEACSWGHAGDGNLHSTFLIDSSSEVERRRAHAAAEELFALAVELGGSVSGEHGLGVLKGGQLRRQWDAPAIALHKAVKNAFDPKGLLNPGKKCA